MRTRKLDKLYNAFVVKANKEEDERARIRQIKRENETKTTNSQTIEIL